MKERSFRADKLDIPAFTAAGATLRGEVFLSRLERLRGSLHPGLPMDQQDRVTPWQARGESRPQRGGTPGQWLHLQVETVAPLTCQRCLRQVDETLSLDRWFRFVDNEALAAELDADDDEQDVLVSSHTFNLLELLEDELLLALPLAPWHAVCPEDAAEPALPPSPPAEPAPARRHPFAALATLKHKLDKGG